MNLSYFLRNKKDFDKNDLIKKFFDFYSSNWEKSRSSWAQDMFVSFCIESSKKKRYKNIPKNSLKYLEIGGWDGVTSSNTLCLKESGY